VCLRVCLVDTSAVLHHLPSSVGVFSCAAMARITMSLFSSLETPVSGGREFDGYSQPPSPVSECSERFGQNDIQGLVDPPGDCASRPLAASGTAATLAAVNFTPDHMRLIQSRMWELEQPGHSSRLCQEMQTWLQIVCSGFHAAMRAVVGFIR